MRNSADRLPSRIQPSQAAQAMIIRAINIVALSIWIVQSLLGSDVAVVGGRILFLCAARQHARCKNEKNTHYNRRQRDSAHGKEGKSEVGPC